ncbi:hypothetical protein D3C87_1717990 [compost metagenome]
MRDGEVTNRTFTLEWIGDGARPLTFTAGEVRTVRLHRLDRHGAVGTTNGADPDTTNEVGAVPTLTDRAEIFGEDQFGTARRGLS